MKNTKFRVAPRVLLSLMLVWLALPLAAHEPTHEGPRLQPALAAGLVAQGVAVIDVRSAEEIVENGRVSDARNIPHTQIDELAEFLGPPPGRPAVLYCRSGRRAGEAIDALEAKGYDSLINAGGQQALESALQARNESNSTLEGS